MRLKLCLQLMHGVLTDLCQPDLAETFSGWSGNVLQLPETGTHIGFVYSGHPILHRKAGNQDYTLHPGMYVCLPQGGWIGGSTSSGLIVTCPSYRGLFSIGGAIEASGRFAYIDGGTDTLLIPPIMQGDPCLNALYFPSGVDQTTHTHPSYRLGLVIAGRGECETPEGIALLEPGMVCLIPANTPHKFRTPDTALALIMFHPDSEIGFTHRDHPMLRRTIVDGVSASHLPQVQTPIEPD